MKGSDAEPKQDPLEAHLRYLAITYGLTDRELEVITHASKGKPNRRIAQDVFISEGTVKAHFHHLHQNLGYFRARNLRP